MSGVTFDCFYKIRDKIGAALILGVDIGSCLLHVFLFGYHCVVFAASGATEQKQQYAHYK